MSEKNRSKGTKREGGNREYKSDVFSMLLEDPKNALDLYNALNGSNYDDPGKVQILRLDRGVSLSMRNDASFIIDSHLSIYEHQSTFSPNMPLRCLIYYVDQLRSLLKHRDLFSRNRYPIPTPHFVVFYNGLENRPPEEILKLSDAFCHPTDTPELEVICRVLNINPTYQEALKERSLVLHGYAYFVEEVRSNRDKGMSLEAAIEQAITTCIENHVLEDFFQTRGNEVKKAMTFDMRWERREKLIREEEYHEGYMAGEASGIEAGEAIHLITLIQRKLARGKTLPEIIDELEESEENILPLYNAIQEKGVDCSAEEIYKSLH